MVKKKINSEAEELKEILEYDSTMDSIPINDIEIIGLCEERGCNTWLFRYKDIHVLLHDAGNGHYVFMEAVEDISGLEIDRNLAGYGKCNRKR